MLSVELWHNETIAARAVASLKKNGFTAEYCADAAAAAEEVLKYIKKGMTVGFGGSMTIKDLGIAQKAEEIGAEILDHTNSSLSQDEKLTVMRRQLTSDLFLCSTNALTLDGELVNIDGVGNRVAAMTFGPKKNIVVAGINKVVINLDAAFDRIENVAAPMNSRRLERPNPCAKTGSCEDCQGQSRICRSYSVIKKSPSRSDFHVIIVGEKLGY